MEKIAALDDPPAPAIPPRGATSQGLTTKRTLNKSQASVEVSSTTFNPFGDPVSPRGQTPSYADNPLGPPPPIPVRTVGIPRSQTDMPSGFRKPGLGRNYTDGAVPPPVLEKQPNINSSNPFRTKQPSEEPASPRALPTEDTDEVDTLFFPEPPSDTIFFPEPPSDALAPPALPPRYN